MRWLLPTSTTTATWTSSQETWDGIHRFEEPEMNRLYNYTPVILKAMANTFPYCPANNRMVATILFMHTKKSCNRCHPYFKRNFQRHRYTPERIWRPSEGAAIFIGTHRCKSISLHHFTWKTLARKNSSSV